MRQSSTMSAVPVAREVMALTPIDVQRLAWVPVPGSPGVHVKELTAEHGNAAVLIAYRAGAVTRGPAHRDASHHLWVVAGQAVVAGRRLRAGSYAHVPVGVAHPIEAGPAGCIILQVHEPYVARHLAE